MLRRLIKASHVVAYQDGGHRHLRDGVVVTEGNQIVHVGTNFDGEVDETLDATGMVLTPGLINTHAHLYESPLDKSFVEDKGNRQFFLSGLFEYLPVRSAAMDDEAARACVAFSMAELLRTGTTTVMEIGSYGDHVVAQAERVGLRAYVGQGYRSGRWYTDDGKTVKYAWDEEAGIQGLEKAVAFVEKIEGRANGRIKGFLTPAQVDTCTEDLLRRSREAATSLGVPLALHASQSVPEFQEMTRRHGLTPIEWLRENGFLGPDVILGHAILPAGGSWVNYHGDDIGILADTGTNVAHAVWVFARRGIAMESFARYLERGVNMTLATDTAPQSMIEAMRWTAVVSKIVDRRTEVATAADVFTAATLGGAKALGRDDLGR
ncbi:MAG: amidohydrolase family protein, partial [Chloroflexota bacterium]|nr:amidohydrolase family protein [Chloroflexota bacterium]